MITIQDILVILIAPRWSPVATMVLAGSKLPDHAIPTYPQWSRIVWLKYGHRSVAWLPMTRFNPFFTVLFVFTHSLFLLGCAAFVRSGSVPPSVFTPAPVTPIAPPAGIRETLSFDPRIHFERSVVSGENEAPKQIQAGLGLCFPNDEARQTIEVEAVAVGSFTASIYSQVCGWRKAGLPIEVSIVLPNGDTIEERVETESMYDKSMFYASYYLSPQPHNLLGTYQFTFEGNGATLTGDDGRFSVEYEVVLPTEPRIYTLQSGTTWLYGFAPGETVQMLRYDVSERGFVEWEGGGGITETYSLVDQRLVTVDDDGTKVVDGFSAEIDSPYGLGSQFVAIGSVSGEISMPTSMYIEESVLLNQ